MWKLFAFRRKPEPRDMPHDVYILASRKNGTLYVGSTFDVHMAIVRERRIKEWRRAWKIELIEKENPGWLDLYDVL